jgi:hypothetical protein
MRTSLACAHDGCAATSSASAVTNSRRSAGSGLVHGLLRFFGQSTAVGLAASAMSFPTGALAACVLGGTSVVCSPNQDGNYAVSSLPDLSVLIQTNANINGTFSATDIGNLTFFKAKHSCVAQSPLRAVTQRFCVAGR